jgi:hypothetical protein
METEATSAVAISFFLRAIELLPDSDSRIDYTVKQVSR